MNKHNLSNVVMLVAVECLDLISVLIILSSGCTMIPAIKGENRIGSDQHI